MSDPPGDRGWCDVLVEERPRLIGLAYRLLGSLSEAEDVVQEASARWLALAPDQRMTIASPGAWLARVTSRICLDELKSARVRRTSYVGAWLPEPIPGPPVSGDGSGDGAADPADRITLNESIHMAFLIMLESMTPAERVALILHDVFGYPFADVAAIVGRTPAACRQLASSARRRLRTATAPDSSSAPAELVRDFGRAWEGRDILALVALLDPAAAACADGGGHVSAVPSPVTGAAQVAGVLVEIAATIPGLRIVEQRINAGPGLVVTSAGAPIAVVAFRFRDDRVERVWAIRNPDKLRPWLGPARDDEERTP